jgi:glycosyltransferase involved in cell wall biosynthesis
MVRVLHILPHRGGGAEHYIDLLAGIDGFEHERLALSAGRTPVAGAISIPLRWPGLALAARRADFVHAHGDVAAALALPLLRARPSVVTTHGLHFLRRAQGARRAAAARAMRAVARSAGGVLCTSQAERDELAALLGPALTARLTVVHNGVCLPAAPTDAERAAARAALGLADGDVAALFLGELSERKAPLHAIDAARRAAAAGAPLVLLVAGDGPQADAVRARASSVVRALGYREDAGRLLLACDVFVLPSEREGLSFAVLEAMAAGLAIVVSDGPGNPEAVGDAGVVVPAADVAALAAALGALARDPAERVRLGAAARARAGALFGVERMLEGVATVYAAALRD